MAGQGFDRVRRGVEATARAAMAIVPGALRTHRVKLVALQTMGAVLIAYGVTAVFQGTLSPFVSANAAPSIEVLRLRTATSSTFRNRNGTFTTKLYSGPVHYRDKAGWHDIDTTLLPSDRGGYGWRSAAGGYTASFKKSLEPRHLRFGVDGSSYDLTLQHAKAQPVQVTGGTASYAGVLPGVSLEYEAVPDGVKETIVLASARATRSFEFLLQPATTAEPTQVVPRRDGSWEVVRSDGTPLFVLRTPTITDAGSHGSSVGSTGDALRMIVTPAKGGYLLRLDVDARWLRSRARHFPVRIDPTISISDGLRDASFNMNCTGTACDSKLWAEPQQLWVGTDWDGNVWDSALQFDLGDIPPGAHVTSAKLRLYYTNYQFNWTDRPQEADLFRMTKPWTESSQSSELAYDAQAEIDNPAAFPTDATRWLEWNATPVVQDWYLGLAPNHGFLVKLAGNGNGDGLRLASRGFTDPGVRPQLEVTWDGDGVNLLRPTVLHANGAELAWERYTGPSGAPFTKYEVHRSLNRQFTPSAETLLATIAEPATTTYRDTTAAPGKTFTYKIVTNGSEPSGERTVTLPAAGLARAFIQPTPEQGRSAYIVNGWGDCVNTGATPYTTVGRSTNNAVFRSFLKFDLGAIAQTARVDSATLSLFHMWSPPTNMRIRVHGVTADWDEGTGDVSCAPGLTWSSAKQGTPWLKPGGDYEPAISARTQNKKWEFPDWDTWDVASLAQRWVSTSLPNNGAVLIADADSYVNTVTSDQPKAYWRLGESQGATVAADSSGNGNNGTYVAPALGEAGAIVGDANTAARLNAERHPHGTERPANDGFAAAQAIAGPSGSVGGTNVNATKEAGEPVHWSGAAGHSVWFTWTAPASGTVTMNDVGSNFDPVLAVYTGTSLSALTLVVRDDDSAGNLKDVVRFAATGGTTYWIAIDDWGESGDLSLRWSLPVTGLPANDAFASPQAVTGDSASAFGTTVGATVEAGEPNHANTTGTPGHSIWYVWTPTQNGSTSIDTNGSDYDTTLAVYTGTALSALTLVGQNDDFYGQQSKVTFDAIAGRQYRIAVDGWRGATGAVGVNVQHAPAWVDMGNRFDFVGQQPFSVEAWVNPSVVDQQYRMIFSKHDWPSGAPRQGYMAWLQGDGIGFERFRDGVRDFVGAPFSATGSWQHVVFTFDGSRISIYVNGLLAASANATQSLTGNPKSFVVGADQGGGSRFSGRIDDVSVYDKALNDDQVWSHFEAGQRLSNQLNYWSDDYAVAPTLRPKLELTYTDGSQAIAPTVAIASPAPGPVKGEVTLSASASDDRRVDAVTFIVDGKPIATDTRAPYEVRWNSRKVANGNHTITAKAVDDATNATTSADRVVDVGNSAAPTTSVQTSANAPYFALVRDDRPLAYWRLGEGPTDTVAVDASPSGYNGTYRGSTVTRGVPGAISGDPNTAARFAGTDDHDVLIDDRDALDFVDAAGQPTDFTVEGWVKTTVNGERAILAKSSGAIPNWRVTVTDDGGYEGRVRAVVETANGVKYAYGPYGLRVDDGAWHHFAVVFQRSAAKVTVWVDGTPRTTGSMPAGTVANTAPLRIGDTSGYPALQGDIDDVAVYNKVLASDRIRAHYRAGIKSARPAYADAVLESAPQAYWRFGEPRMTGRVLDSSGYDLDGYYRHHTEKGVQGALANDADTAIRLHGVGDDCGFVAENAFVDDPDGTDFGRDDFSVEVWVRTSRNLEQAVIAKGGSRPRWFVTVTDDTGEEGRIRVKFQNGVDPDRTLYGPNIRVDDDKWHHVVVAFERAFGAHIYVDGVASDERGPISGDVSNGDNLEIGATPGYIPFLGDIDEVALYPKALGPLRVRAHYVAGSQGSDYAQAVLKDGPRGYWRLGEAVDSSQAADASGNGNTAEYQGPETGSEGGLAVDPDTSARFDREDFAYVGDKFDFAGTAAFSLEAWIRPSAITGGYPMIFAKHTYVNAKRQGWLFWHQRDSSTGKSYLALERFRDGVGDSVATEAMLNANEWAYVVVTYDGNTATIYVNGVREANKSGMMAQLLDTTASVKIGSADGWANFRGDIDEPAIYNRALSPAEVRKHHDAAFGEGLPVTGAATVTANASDDVAVTKVELLVDGGKIDEKAAPPYTFTWDTLSPATPAFDGMHVLTTKAYDAHDNVTTSKPLRVTVGNTADTRYQAQITGTPIPPAMTYDAGSTVQETAEIAITVKNTSSVTWTAGSTSVGYRWLDALTGAVVTSATVPLTASAMAPGDSATATVAVPPPTLGVSVDRAQYRLQVDAVENGSTWYATRGNAPLQGTVTVTKIGGVGLGLERFWQYEGDDVGAGMQHLVNLASGNSIVRWTPFDAPGRGLSTVVDLTYNSYDTSSGFAGTGWSLAVSTLSRLGTPLQIGANTVTLTDGDGTQHVFKLKGGAYVEPPGVHLFLRRSGTGDKTWAFTRADRVTFYYDANGWPTTVEDRNGNRLLFTDDGAGKITAVTDAGGTGPTDLKRTFQILYYTASDGVATANIGKVKRIVDHTDPSGALPDRGSSLAFTYNDDGTLRTLEQENGVKADGSYLIGRQFFFRYGTLLGAKRLVYVDDPRTHTTAFTYDTANGTLQKRTNRGGADAVFTYDLTNRVTTAKEPAHQNASTYTFNPGGQVTKIVNPLGQATKVQWNEQRRPVRVIEPSGAYSEYAYDDNGYLTDTWNQLRDHTTLEYEYIAVDGNDVAANWGTGRTQPHISQLIRKTDPKGTVTAVPGDYVWRFVYDEAGNPVESIDAEEFHTFQTWNKNGTLAATTDANGHKTSYSAYDDNGLPTEIVEANGNTATFGYDVDGLLRWRQSPNQASESGGTSDQQREYRTVFEYDSFHRLERQSAPKENKRGSFGGETIVWSAVDYDPNDNLIAEYVPAYGYPGYVAGTKTIHRYDDLDRVSETEEAARRAGTFTLATVAQADSGVTIRVDSTAALYEGLVVDVLRGGQPVANGANREIAVVDRANNKITLTDPNAAVTVAAGDTVNEEQTVRIDLSTPRRVRFTHDAADRLAAVTLPGVSGSSTPDDFTTRYVYDELDRVVQQTVGGALPPAADPADARITRFCYDLAGDLRSVTSPRNQDAPAAEQFTGCADASRAGPEYTPTAASFTSSYSYDRAHRLIGQKDPLGNQQSLTYNANGEIEAMLDAAGTKATREYDERGYAAKEIVPFKNDPTTGSVTRYLTTKYEYDGVGNLVREITPRAWDASADKRRFSDYVTEYHYDVTDRLIRTDLPSDGTRSRTYLHYSYDGDDRMTSVSQPTETIEPANLTTADKTTMSYYDTGWVRSTDDPAKGPVFFDYTAEGWQSRRTSKYKNDAGAELDWSVERWSYYPDGLLEQETDGKGDSTIYRYDLDGNVRTIRDASGLAHSKQTAVNLVNLYDRFGEATTVRERLRPSEPWHVTQAKYDRNGNQWQRVDEQQSSSDARIHTLGFDAADQLVWHTDVAGDGTNCAGAQRQDYTYAKTGWMMAELDRRSDAGTCPADKGINWPVRQRSAYTYFANGITATATTWAGEAKTLASIVESHDVSYEDDQGRFVDGNKTRDKFSLAQPSDVTTPACWAPDASKTCTAIYQYDGADRLTYWDNGLKEGGGRQTATYSLDPQGNVLELTTTGTGAVHKRFGYSPGGALVDEKVPDGTGGWKVSRQYYYSQTANPDEGRGNLKCITKPAVDRSTCYRAPADPGIEEWYSYDKLDRMASFRRNSGQEFDAAEYVHDAFDRLAWQSDTFQRNTSADPNTSVLERQSRVTDFAYLGASSDLSAERQWNGDNDPTTDDSSAIGDPAKAQGTKAYRYDGFDERAGLDATAPGGARSTYSYGRNGHGDISLLLDQTQSASVSVRAAYGYTPYGDSDTALSSGDAAATGTPTDAFAGTKPLNPFRFNDFRLDAASGSIDMGFRRFGPDTGRFLQDDFYSDALGDIDLATDPLTGNRYGLAGGNPVNFVEVDGHFFCEIWELIKNHGNPFGHYRATDCRRAEGILKDVGQEVASQIIHHPHEVLDACGVIDPIGPVCDLGNSVYYATEGKWLMSVTSAGAAVPIAGDAVLAGKYGTKAASRFKILRKFPGRVKKCMNSFAAGTVVLMADGRELPIEDVQVGDEVLATDPLTGETGPHRVDATIRGTKSEHVVLIDLADGATLSVTPGHRMWVDGSGWLLASDVEIGDELRQPDGSMLRIVGVRDHVVKRTVVFNLVVDGVHTYFVGTVPVLVHNGLDCFTFTQSVPDPKKLARNLGKRPSGGIAHHIVAGTAKKAQEARDLLDKYAVDINSATNGVWITKKGGHPTAYYEAVNSRLQTAVRKAPKGWKAKQKALEKELARIRRDIKSGKLKT